MKEISETDFNAILRCLDVLSGRLGKSVREREESRRSYLLAKKLRRKLVVERGAE